MLLECVPNFSEGRDQAILNRIALAIKRVPDVVFLGMDASASANRTVMTFAGAPAAVLEAAFQAIRTAAQWIDMRQHQGVHPRIGACDVCPLIPLQGITMQTATALARKLAQRVGETLEIPTYTYGFAALKPDRHHLSQIRQGGYEALATKLSKAEHAPDFGPARFHAKSGATVIGTRHLMLAYNMDLDRGDLRLAKWIASRIRESGRKTKRGHHQGLFKGVKAIGWKLPEENRIQISTNIMDLHQAPLHLVFEKTRELAARKGGLVLGSELVGLMPRQVLLDAGSYFQPSVSDDTARLQAGVNALGLNRFKGFHVDKHLLENGLQLSDNLVSSTLNLHSAAAPKVSQNL